VPGFGPVDASLAVAGLAPAVYGSHRTGRIFTGDPSGDGPNPTRTRELTTVAMPLVISHRRDTSSQDAMLLAGRGSANAAREGSRSFL
jgi:hypothetical protein